MPAVGVRRAFQALGNVPLDIAGSGQPVAPHLAAQHQGAVIRLQCAALPPPSAMLPTAPWAPRWPFVDYVRGTGLAPAGVLVQICMARAPFGPVWRATQGLTALKVSPPSLVPLSFPPCGPAPGQRLRLFCCCGVSCLAGIGKAHGRSSCPAPCGPLFHRHRFSRTSASTRPGSPPGTAQGIREAGPLLSAGQVAFFAVLVGQHGQGLQAGTRANRGTKPRSPDFTICSPVCSPVFALAVSGHTRT